MTASTAQTRAGCDPQAAAELLRALAHPMRLRILCRLLDGELSVGGFESELGLRQPSLSQQLALLREAGLVTTRREARSVVYGVADDRVRIVLDALRQALGEAAAPPHTAARKPLRTAPPTIRTTIIPPGRAGECGVFSAAGWTMAPGGSRDHG